MEEHSSSRADSATTSSYLLVPETWRCAEREDPGEGSMPDLPQEFPANNSAAVNGGQRGGGLADRRSQSGRRAGLFSVFSLIVDEVFP